MKLLEFDVCFFLFQRGQLFRISKISSSILPVMYQLEDLMGSAILGQFYAANLHLAPQKSLSEFFEVEKILKSKKIDNEKFVFVKYQFYPKKFNQWVKFSDLKVNDT